MPTPRPIDAALAWLRRGDPERSLRELEQLLAATPRDASLHNALGSVLAASGRYADAAESFEHALHLQPAYAAARVNLGQVQLESGELPAAVRSFEAALRAPGAPVQAELGLARAACLLGRFAEADAAFARALARPDAHAAAASQRCYAALFDPALDARQVIALHRTCAARLPTPSPLPARAPGAKLVLGYLSPHFREHSIASFMEGVLVAHDRTRCEVHLYSDVRQPDATSARLAAAVDGYHATSQLSHAELAALCRSHGVDVLIDLQGHMQPNRLPALALGAAHVVLSYLGYPGSTGIPWLAGRLTDGWADPGDDPRQIGPEPPLRIAGGYFAYTPPAAAPPPSAADGEHVTFGSFNDALKLNDDVLATWAELLSRCDARLLLKTRALAWPAVRERVLSAFSARGVDPSRVELCPATTTRREHLALYARVDVALDTFPYAGATTTCEALYMGVPVVSLAGDRHAARMGVSILSALGQPDWITHSREQYIALALAWLPARDRRHQLRASLRERMLRSPLCDARRVAHAIEEHAQQRLQART